LVKKQVFMDMADNPFNIGYGEEEEFDRPRLSMSRALNLDSDSGSGMFDAAGFIGDRNFQNPNDRNFMSYLFEGLADAGMVGDSFRRARQGKVDRIEFRNKQLKDAINMLPEDDQKIMALSEADFFGKDPKTSESARQLALKMRNKRLLEESYKKADRENLEELRRREATKFDQAQEDREITLARNKEKYERDKKDYQRRLIKDKFKNSREIQKFLADPYNPPTQQMKDEVNEFRKLSGQAPYTENDFVSFQSKGKQKLFSELLKSGKVSNLSSTQIRDMTNNLPLSPEQKKEIQSKMLAQKDQKELDEAYSKFNKLVKNKYGLNMDKFLSTAFSDDDQNFIASDAQVARHLLGGDKAAVESLLKDSTKVGASSRGLMRRFLKNFNNARLTRDNLLAKGSGRSKEENTELAKVQNQIKNFNKVLSTWGKGIDENFFLGTAYNMPDEEKEEVKSSAKSKFKVEGEKKVESSSKVEENEKPFSEVGEVRSDDLEEKFDSIPDLKKENIKKAFSDILFDKMKPFSDLGGLNQSSREVRNFVREAGRLVSKREDFTLEDEEFFRNLFSQMPKRDRLQFREMSEKALSGRYSKGTTIYRFFNKLKPFLEEPMVVPTSSDLTPEQQGSRSFLRRRYGSDPSKVVSGSGMDAGYE